MLVQNGLTGMYQRAYYKHIYIKIKIKAYTYVVFNTRKFVVSPPLIKLSQIRYYIKK